MSDLSREALHTVPTSHTRDPDHHTTCDTNPHVTTCEVLYGAIQQHTANTTSEAQEFL